MIYVYNFALSCKETKQGQRRGEKYKRNRIRERTAKRNGNGRRAVLTEISPSIPSNPAFLE
jgi:hypothetical protein